MTTLERYSGAAAKRTVNRLVSERDMHGDPHVQIWNGCRNHKMGYLVRRDGAVVSFAILSKLDYDPEGEMDDAYNLEYIYTFPEHRRKGFASFVVNRLKSHLNVITFAMDSSVSLFKRAGYRYRGQRMILHHFRTPLSS